MTDGTNQAGEGILDGVRVLDLSTGIAGPVATMLLAEVGADVVKVEPSLRDPGRDHPGYRTWNRSKRSVALDISAEEGRRQLEQLLGAADVLVHEMGPAAAAAAGLDDDALAARHPRLIVSSVLSWPANHPDADRPVDETLAMARLGVFDEQLPWMRSGPTFLRFPIGSWGAVYTAATGIIARLIHRRRTGIAGPAHTSLVQGAMVPIGMHWSRAERPSAALAAGFPKEGRGSQATIYECRDGGWIHVMGNPLQVPRIADFVAGYEGEGPVPFALRHPGIDWVNPATALVANFRTAPRSVWLEELWTNDVPVQPCEPFGAVFDDEQARTNGYVIDIDDPEEGSITVGGMPLTVTPPQTIKGPAPAQGAHTAEVLAEWTAADAAEPEAPSTGERSALRYPLEGVKVLDLGNYLAGPYAAQMLADLGADVVKLESTTGDPMRAAAWPFAGCQRGKRGLALDLKSPEARPALEAALAWADVVHHNLRMPAARRLGLDYDSVRLVNPDVVFCHASSYGPLGARADWPGYDQLFQAQCGWEVEGAGEGNPPMWLRFGFMDHQCAMSSAVATLLALYYRDRTGKGQAVAGSLLGAGALTASETFRRRDGTLAPHARLDALQIGVSEGRRIVEVMDGWLAVAADRPDQINALRDVNLRGQGLDDALGELAAAGVPAEEVRLEQRYPFFDDPANQAAGLVAAYDHAEWGKLEQPGGLWWFANLNVRLELAPPALGEHTVEVLGDMGLDRGTIDALIAGRIAVQHGHSPQDTPPTGT
ncbi:CoA transferase [Acidiferrimicrobium sp. IK]|uniref:CoA transferase n=1 Tax=Acidiferrimicrobium sp. IK TaxID=2871700 RepID=UPI0021CB99F7|nr:CoA transferase [Acidiferrimicrobium sp. IK]MCU4186828.1 CoA transferase [Acidiferrimicrobium sp. IK]